MTATNTPAPRGVLLIVSSPSGAGKTTLARRLMTEFPDIDFSVSYTTRARRGAEQHGRDYFFVEDAEFDRMIAAGAFAEWAYVHGNRYGTARAVVEAALADGRDVLYDVDGQGGKALGEQWPADALKVFVLPPSHDVLERRLRARHVEIGCLECPAQRGTNAEPLDEPPSCAQAPGGLSEPAVGQIEGLPHRGNRELDDVSHRCPVERRDAERLPGSGGRIANPVEPVGFSVWQRFDEIRVDGRGGDGGQRQADGE